ncbi:MAG: FkbM family methyltransferase [Goleter apudmare HA4340-LM2]|jgi:FkbM family methyltransferase|nr:FkbM family methyltransferase [Goleter apudmare HA4340-LM2]
MNFFNRLHYGLQAIRKSRFMTINPLASTLFFLIPERLSRLMRLVCHFRWQRFEFLARRLDWGPVDTVLLGGEYDFVERLLEDYDQPTIIDLGANIGTFSLFVFSCSPSAIVHSVEASASVYTMLEQNCRKNPSLDSRTYQAAVWSSSGQLQFQTNTQASTQGKVSQNGNEVVNAITLTQLLNNHVQGRVDLLKMDIEGAEEEVLCASEPLLSQVEQIVVQIHPNYINRDRVEQVLRRTFDFLYCVPNRLSPNPLLVAARRPQGYHLETLWERDNKTF